MSPTIDVERDASLDRLDELRRELRITLNGLEAINTRLGRLDTMTADDAAQTFGNLDAQLHHLLIIRHALHGRVTAHLAHLTTLQQVA